MCGRERWESGARGVVMIRDGNGEWARRDNSHSMQPSYVLIHYLNSSYNILGRYKQHKRCKLIIQHVLHNICVFEN